MNLVVCSTAAPDAALPELLHAAARRGLAGIELAGGGGHGLGPLAPQAELAAARRAAADAGAGIASYRAASLEEAASCECAHFAAFLGLAVIAPCAWFDDATLARTAECYRAAGARLVLTHGSDPDEAGSLRERVETVALDSLGLGWEVRPGDDDPAAAPAVLRAAGPRLEYVRLHGGGPESPGQTGQGVGAVMARLTLARYRGPLVLTPSTPRYHEVWRRWLGRDGGWGCGSKTSDPSLVQISA